MKKAKKTLEYTYKKGSVLDSLGEDQVKEIINSDRLEHIELNGQGKFDDGTEYIIIEIKFVPFGVYKK